MKKRVAIIGCSFRFPGTDSTRFWQDLIAEKDLITEVDSERWAKDTFKHPGKKHPGTSFTFAAGSIGDIAQFDADFFGISPREAALMDPQQRLLLEMSWEAAENSGIKPSSLRGSQCGVFIGMATTDYASCLADDLSAIDSQTATGTASSIAANRISYTLDLRGPSMVIDTACSSSMVAFHQACNSIRSGECSQALVGGISLHIHPYGFIIFSKASMLSPQGRCNPFDASGDGYVRSEGGGIFFLKDYDQAIADGNSIIAVVANSANNTDGHKSSLTIPSYQAQAELLHRVYQQAGIDPDSIDYIEAHGTGTAVGDPIETRAIGVSLGTQRSKSNPLPIGSVKSNLGHLEAASAIAGLAKAVYCIQHRIVPATIGIKKLNPNIQFDAWNIEVVTQQRPLKATGKLTIGVNSFGFGGANAHVILESYEQKQQQPKLQVASPTKDLPFILSAKNNRALQAAAQDFSAFLESQPNSSLYNIAHNALFKRDLHAHRLVAYGNSTKDLAKALLNFSNEENEQYHIESGIALQKPCGTAFIYSGNGSQWFGMGKKLLQEEPLFRASIQEIDLIFQRYADYSLEDELAGKNGPDRYEYTEIAQPALFALQVGITKMLRHQGIAPLAVAGHSVGEIAAAWASGALTLEAAVAVIYHRSHYQGTTKGKGKMTAVGLGLEAIHHLLNDLDLSSSLTIAGQNSSRGVTIAGCPELLSCLESALTEQGIFYKRLDLDYAFHSPAMDEIEPGIKQALATLKPRKTLVPFYSSVTGALLDGTELGADYWWHNIRQPVLFEQAIKSIISDDNKLFIEVGPHAVLRSYINDCLNDLDTEGRIIPTMVRDDDTRLRILAATSQAIIAGASIDWHHSFPTAGTFVQLPNYPWQRERHWLPITSESIGLLHRHKIHPLLGYPLQQQELTWENQLDSQLYPTLADHVVGEAIVFPAAGYSELALAAALAWLPGNLAALEELEIHAPLLLSAKQSKLIRFNIDALDGSWTLKGRDYASEELWTLYAQGRILSEPSDILLDNEKRLLPTRAADFNSNSHQALTLASGLAYGPAFQCIHQGWIQKNSVLAELKIPESISKELITMHLHPALLDCTFQLIFHLLKEDADNHEGIAFIPTKMGKIAFRASKSMPSVARATLLRKTHRSLSAEFTIIDADGLAIIVIKEVRFRSIRLSSNPADHLRFLDYHAVPAPLALASHPKPIISFASIQRAMTQLAKHTALSSSQRRYSEEVEPLLDMLCSQFTLEALQLLSTTKNTLSAAEVSAYQQANPDIAPLLSYLLSLSENDQFLSFNEDTWNMSADQCLQISAQDIWNCLITDYPDYFQIIHSVGRIGMHLNSLLDGRLSFNQLCLQASTLATLAGQALGTDGQQKIGQMLRDLVIKGIAGLRDGQRLGIIEISQGLASFALDACVSMDFRSCDYIFASTSSATLEEMTRLKERFPLVDTALIEPSSIAITKLGTCQIAIVTLDFNSPSETLAALTYARDHLAPSGALIVLGLHPARWIDFVFGGQYSHWSVADNGTWLSNHRSAEFWEQQLYLKGFLNTNIVDFSPDTQSGSYLLLAQLAEHQLAFIPSSNRASRNWVLLADQDGYSAQLSDHLAKKLQALGDFVIQTYCTDTTELEALLLKTSTSYGRLDGILHLAGLLTHSSVMSADLVVQRQVTRCAIAANIIQACASSSTDTVCWLITKGANPELLPRRDHANIATSASIPVDAALWGFGRTLINESSNYSVRLVDFENLIELETLVSALVSELERPDDEQEIILSIEGARYAPRLNLTPKPEPKKHQEMESSMIHLGFQFPGQLRNLRWEVHPRSTPAADEIEIEVHASGLNFRDVMFTLGLLSDEAIENGFSGPTLGLEFSGVVIKVGRTDSEFSLGDKVVGFGPSSFGNKVISKANAITPIPSGMSFEAAATIPSTFFTVYYSLHYLARLQPDEKILIHCAAGGVGIAAIQIAKWLGAEIYATAGSDEKRDFLKLLGVDYIFDSRSLAFSDEILALTHQKGVDVVLNSLAGEAINRNFRVLKPFGRFLELGKRDFYENTKIGLRPFRNNISYFGIDADQLLKLRPELTRSLFAELMTLFTQGILKPLPYHTFDAEDIVDAFRYMQQARQIGKIIITYKNGIHPSYSSSSTPALQSSLVLPADASYLVTGGLSGFGLRSAEWLVSKGARNLILISRSGPSSEEAISAIARLEKQGVHIHAVSCDITDKTAIIGLLTETAQRLPPLKGIIHAATVINDGLICNMDAKQIRSVLAPKVLGAQYLHELTLANDLDLFILFSSATTLFGNPGQANYVAANSCLEALANHRRSLKLPATCVHWGAIDDVGFLARNEQIKEALQGRMGGSALNSAIALDALESMLINDRSGLGVMELDWHALARFLPSAKSPKFRELARLAGDDHNYLDNADDIHRMLEELSDSELLSALTEMIKSEIGEILHISPNKINPTCSVYDMGLDSLMGVELLVALESRFGTRLSVMALNQNPTIVKLAELIRAQLNGSYLIEEDADKDALLTLIKQTLLQHDTAVTPEYMANLIADIQGEFNSEVQF